jgi:Spy/CpxP family protein refolding chaperone
MNRRWMITVCVLMAAAGFAGGRFSVRPAADFDPARDLQPVHLTRLLGLSDAQAAQVNTLGSDYEARVKKACDAHCAARCRLAHALQDESATSAQLHQYLERMCASQQENDRATLEHLLKVREILTPEQRQKFATSLGACLCEACGGQGDTCCGVDAANP